MSVMLSVGFFNTRGKVHVIKLIPAMIHLKTYTPNTFTGARNPRAYSLY